MKNELRLRRLGLGRKHLLLAAIMWLTFTGAAFASEVHGLVTAHGLPVPGATVTLTEGDKKFATVTDSQGLYSLADVGDGAATIIVEMTGFAPMKQSVTIAPDAAMGKWELTQLTLDQVRAALKPVISEPFTATQVRSEPQKTAEAPKPAAGKAADKPGAPAAAPPEEVADRASDGLLINGSVNNAATSQFSMAPRFGNTASGKSMYQYGLNLRLDNSALNAKSYSLTGYDTTKPNTSQLTGGFSVQGPLKIPHLLLHGPNVYLGYQRVQNGYATTTSGIMPVPIVANTDYALSSTVDIPATGITPSCNTYLLSKGLSQSAINSGTTAFPGTGAIPWLCLSPAAKSLLALYPQPNFPQNLQGNYQIPLISDTHTDQMNTYAYKPIGRKDFINGNFSLSSTRGSSGNIFGFVDDSNTLGVRGNITWSHTFNRNLRSVFSYDFSRQSSRSTPYWQNRKNISGDAGIVGNDQDQTYWGPPALNFTSGIAGLWDGQSSFNRDETNAISPSMSWNHKQHNVAFGFDFRRQQYNYMAQANPRGSFTFTGAATAGVVTGGGSDLADFLLGIPDASSISYGNADKYLRQSVYDLYVRDDWRMSPQLTLNVGIRWDYGAPVTEVKNRLANLDVASGFTSVAPVLASSPVGTKSGQSFPTSLVRPDRAGFQPRIGASWRPIPGSSLVIGAGYGVNFDTSTYQGIALQMANQAELLLPTSKVLSLTNSTTCPLTLTNGFPVAVNGVNLCKTAANNTLGTFGVDPNYRVGYVQTWNLKVQRDLPASLQMVAIYAGNKGTRGAQLFLPNTYPVGYTGSVGSGLSGFEYLASGGNSTRESGQLQLRRRLHNGFTASALYTYSKSIDDDSSFGGKGASVSGSIAQDWQNLSAERGLSSFDQRHVLSASAQYTTGMGMKGGTLLSGWRGRLYKEWTVQTQINAGSGLPETPSYAATTIAGFTSTVRPNVTGASLYAAPSGRHLNPDAYTAPGSGTWGNARRSSITGPNQFTLNASMQRTFRVKDKYTMDLQFSAANLLNHVTYSGWQRSINSTQFGLPTSANSMRDINASLRMRF